ncbi:MAG TPA: hypothetical protein VG675_15040 [Bryobacteraceae bacterium]|nr:hypothetical protein [Bryobacteraceae bacterium]
MKAFSILAALIALIAPALSGDQNLDTARRLETSGDLMGARNTLATAARDNPHDITALANYAEFLDAYGDPACREAYNKLLTALRASGDQARAAVVARRLAVLDLIAGENEAAARSLEAYHASGGKDLKLGSNAAAEKVSTITIPGPLRSFARMAAISSEATPDEVLPALARNVVTNGYQASHSNDTLEQTEYLKLVHRYLSQARELEKLAGVQKAIKIEKCESPNVGELLRILGFRMRGGCGSDLVLETVNAARAFLTTDSGFPVHELELDLRTDRPFSYDFGPTKVNVLFGADYWMGNNKEKEQPEFIDVFIGDPALCRLYLGFSKLDRETAEDLRKGVSYTRLKAYAHVLDFFGGMFEIRNGKAVVPGGAHAAAAWAELAGASPDKGAAFFEKLLSKDDGWLASMYDALARINGPVQDYLTEPARLKRFYAAVRGHITSPGPARPVFRSNTDMMLLTTRLQIDPNGKPHIPGDLNVWKDLFVDHPQGKYDSKLSHAAAAWKDPDDVLEALFGLCRKSVENEPLKIFMALTDVDRNRVKPLLPETVDRLARNYRAYGAQYSIFTESPALSDKSIDLFLDTAENLTKIRNTLFRADASGICQSLVSLWQILVRQQSLPPARADETFAAILTPFTQVKSDRELFEAGRSGVHTLLAAAGLKGEQQPQERILDLLSGGQEGDAAARTQISQELVRILDAQRIVSVDTLFDLAAQLESGKPNTAQTNKLTAQIHEIQLPRPSLSSSERNALGFGYWTEKHIDEERKLNLREAIEKAGGDPQKLKDVCGLMAPLLRDTLVAYNYAHYAPPGAQILYTNPVFVRSHDFIGSQGSSRATWRATETYGTGWPSNGGGRLVGSLATLPYALAEAEQNFLIPTQTQALIWTDLVPQMILSAVAPSWWRVTPAQIHWVGLHLRYGRSLLAEAAFDPELRPHVMDTLSSLASPARTRKVERLLEQGDVKDAVEDVTPSELYLLVRRIAPKRPDTGSWLAEEIRRIGGAVPDQVSDAAISRAFGTPKPTLATTYEPELLNIRTFPALMGYSSRIMAESWESNTLYWAALADETYTSPGDLNVRIPEWTEQLVENIFASHLEDWPAVLKSLRVVGDDVRAHSQAALATEQKASLQGFPNR